MILRLRADVSMCDTDDGVALLDERTGRYWQLNRSGALILNGLFNGDTPHQIADNLTRQYEVSRDEAVRDVTALVAELSDAALVI